MQVQLYNKKIYVLSKNSNLKYNLFYENDLIIEYQVIKLNKLNGFDSINLMGLKSKEFIVPYYIKTCYDSHL